MIKGRIIYYGGGGGGGKVGRLHFRVMGKKLMTPPPPPIPLEKKFSTPPPDIWQKCLWPPPAQPQASPAPKHHCFFHAALNEGS